MKRTLAQISRNPRRQVEVRVNGKPVPWSVEDDQKGNSTIINIKGSAAWLSRVKDFLNLG